MPDLFVSVSKDLFVPFVEPLSTFLFFFFCCACEVQWKQNGYIEIQDTSPGYLFMRGGAK
jgi:hypothetical protein